MSKRKATEKLDYQVKRGNISKDFVYDSSAKTTHTINKMSPTKIGKRPIYKFFINYDNKYYPLR